MSPLRKHLYLSAQRGADWLQRRNKPDGRFLYGFSPSLRQPLEEDSFLAQIEAVFALAQSARFFGNDDAAAIARQALLTQLLNTTIDPHDKKVRYTIPSSSMVNRPAAAGLLLLAISELPHVIGKDLLDQADELSNFLRREFQTDGSVPGSPEVQENFSGAAVLGVCRSQRLNPAPWKLEILGKARVFYQAYWQRHKNAAMIPEHTAAFSEAFLLTHDRRFADFVFEMNDWLLSQQYQNMDPARQHWTGGFMPHVDGKTMLLAPNARSAQAAHSLAAACRTAQAAGELGRLGRYRDGLESCLKFLTTLQYTQANTLHFADWYRPLLVGGFHASASDGNLRIDYTLHAVAALVEYLEFVVEP